MKLSTYLEQSSRGTAAGLARELDVSPVTVAQWASGLKTPHASRAFAIELATGGAVKRWDLRPDDWHRIWPELVGKKGAPKVPEVREEG